MDKFDLYKDIKERTGGDVYLGVVGPVRTGKSTFISGFMNKTVLPRVTSAPEKERMVDELPQSANGSVVMTTQPKFVPAEAVAVSFDEHTQVNVRLVDCVGYLVEGAGGSEENGKPRMVNTPWSASAIPFEEAARIGTEKVIADHATVGVVVTTDGSIDTGISRKAYEEAEAKVVGQLKELGKPFVIALNSAAPTSQECESLAQDLREKYATTVLCINAKEMTDEDVTAIFAGILAEFPLRRIDFTLPKWMQALPFEHPVIVELCQSVKSQTEQVSKLSDADRLNGLFEESEYFEGISQESSALGEGKLTFAVTEKPNLFYQALSDACGTQIVDDFALMSSVKELVFAKKQFDKLSSALSDADEYGYGIVEPSGEDVVLEEPQIEKKGGRYGVKLKAGASTYHIVKVDVSTEVSPLMGAELQSEDTVKRLMEQLSDKESASSFSLFGKSLSDVVSENLNGKTQSMQPETKKKMRKALCRIVNEGKGGVICILL